MNIKDSFFAQGGSDDMPVISISQGDFDFDISEFPDSLPLLPLKNMVPFPGIIIPITVGRNSSLAALDDAEEREDKLIAVIAQNDPTIERPQEKDLNRVGTIARIVKVLDLPQDNTTAI